MRGNHDGIRWGQLHQIQRFGVYLGIWLSGFQLEYS